MNQPSPSRWAELWAQALSIIDQANKDGVVLDRWSFGGGTALMLHIDHRDSHDIDLFIDDPQVLPLLNPATQGYKLDLAPDDYETNGTSALKITFAGIGEIDFICGQTLTEPGAVQKDVEGRDVWLETPEEIITKKIFYRGARIQPRDMFDIAAVVRANGADGLVAALRPYSSQCGTALAATERWDTAAAVQAINQLIMHDRFANLATSAQSDTRLLLRRVLNQ